jgi:hypothetical protein
VAKKTAKKRVAKKTAKKRTRAIDLVRKPRRYTCETTGSKSGCGGGARVVQK